MKKFIGFLFGSSPLTTIGGYITAGYYAYQDISVHGITSWKQAIIPFGIAFLGRLAKQSNGISSKQDKENASVINVIKDEIKP